MLFIYFTTFFVLFIINFLILFSFLFLFFSFRQSSKYDDDNIARLSNSRCFDIKSKRSLAGQNVRSLEMLSRKIYEEWTWHSQCPEHLKRDVFMFTCIKIFQLENNYHHLLSTATNLSEGQDRSSWTVCFRTALEKVTFDACSRRVSWPEKHTPTEPLLLNNVSAYSHNFWKIE